MPWINSQKNNKPMYALIAFTNGKSFGSYKIEDGYKLSQFSAPQTYSCGGLV